MRATCEGTGRRARWWLAALLLVAVLGRGALPAGAVPADSPPLEPFTWWGAWIGSGMLPWYHHPRGGFSFGAGAQRGPGLLAFDLEAGAGPVVGMPEALFLGRLAAGLVGGVAAEGEARPFAGGRISLGICGSERVVTPGAPALYLRVGGSAGLMIRPGGRSGPDPAAPQRARSPGRAGLRLAVEPSFALLPVGRIFGAELQLKFAVLVW